MHIQYRHIQFNCRCLWVIFERCNAEYFSGQTPSLKIIDTMLEDVEGYEQPHAKRPLLYMKTYPQHVVSSQFMIFFGYLNGPKNICVSPKIRTDTYDFLDHLNRPEDFWCYTILKLGQWKSHGWLDYFGPKIIGSRTGYRAASKLGMDASGRGGRCARRVRWVTLWVTES